MKRTCAHVDISQAIWTHFLKLLYSSKGVLKKAIKKSCFTFSVCLGWRSTLLLSFDPCWLYKWWHGRSLSKFWSTWCGRSLFNAVILSCHTAYLTVFTILNPLYLTIHSQTPSAINSFQWEWPKVLELPVWKLEPRLLFQYLSSGPIIFIIGMKKNELVFERWRRVWAEEHCQIIGRLARQDIVL